MDQRGFFTHAEIFSQPQAWEAALEHLHIERQEIRNFYQEGNYDRVIFTGCGSTYYLSLAAASLFQELTGALAVGLPASELWLYPRSSYPAAARTLLVAVSRSGETTETLRACQAFRDAGHGGLLTLSCYADAPLASLGDLNLVLPSGAERSVAQTRAFSTLYLATVFLAGLCSGENGLVDELSRLPQAGRQVLEKYSHLAARLGEDRRLERFYFLGSGPRYGLACELSLKMKEMSLSHSEPFHFLEFRHGPQSMVNAGTLMIGLVSQANRLPELTVIEEMRARGAQVLGMSVADTSVVFDTALSEAANNLLYLPVGQVLAFSRSLDHDLDPDRPHNLDAVVRLGEQA